MGLSPSVALCCAAALGSFLPQFQAIKLGRVHFSGGFALSSNSRIHPPIGGGSKSSPDLKEGPMCFAELWCAVVGFCFLQCAKEGDSFVRHCETAAPAHRVSEQAQRCKESKQNDAGVDSSGGGGAGRGGGVERM